MITLSAIKEKNKTRNLVMGIFRFFGELLLIYLAYKIIFELIIPAVTITKRAKQMMDDVNQQQQNTTATNSSKKTNHDDEYIDYEEVK